MCLETLRGDKHKVYTLNTLFKFWSRRAGELFRSLVGWRFRPSNIFQLPEVGTRAIGTCNGPGFGENNRDLGIVFFSWILSLSISCWQCFNSQREHPTSTVLITSVHLDSGQEPEFGLMCRPGAWPVMVEPRSFRLASIFSCRKYVTNVGLVRNLSNALAPPCPGLSLERKF